MSYLFTILLLMMLDGEYVFLEQHTVCRHSDHPEKDLWCHGGVKVLN